MKELSTVMMWKDAATACLGILLVFALPATGAMRTTSCQGRSGPVAQGRCIAVSPRLGDCTACHAIAGTSADGTVGPALRDIRQVFPNKTALFAEIYDPTIMTPRTAMPPFGKYRILSRAQIHKLVDFLWTL